MESAYVGVHKEIHQVRFTGFLNSGYGGALEANVCLDLLRNLTDEPLEWQLPDQQICGFLVPSDFSKSYSTWPVTVGSPHSSSEWRTFASCFSGLLFTRPVSTGGFTCHLLVPCHLNQIFESVYTKDHFRLPLISSRL
jgi:hypothetical protein